MNKLIFGILILLISSKISAQCESIEATISSPRLDSFLIGSILLCNESNDTEILSTQEFDSYQWYRKAFSIQNPNPNPWIPIDNATSQELEINAFNNLLDFIKVEITLDTCTVESATVFIDGYVYALPTMLTQFEDGTFEQVGQGEFNVCNGATVTISNGFPAVNGEHYWYSCIPSDIPPVPGDSCIIENAIGDTIVVDQSGTYGYYACTEYCPDQCQFLGTANFTSLNFGDFDFCATNTPETDIELLTLFPNPAQYYLSLNKLKNNSEFRIEIYNVEGSLVLSKDNYTSGTSLDISSSLISYVLAYGNLIF